MNPSSISGFDSKPAAESSSSKRIEWQERVASILVVLSCLGIVYLYWNA